MNKVHPTPSGKYDLSSYQPDDEVTLRVGAVIYTHRGHKLRNVDITQGNKTGIAFALMGSNSEIYLSATKGRYTISHVQAAINSFKKDVDEIKKKDIPRGRKGGRPRMSVDPKGKKQISITQAEWDYLTQLAPSGSQAISKLVKFHQEKKAEEQ